MKINKLKKFEIIGALLSIFFGSALHFVFELSGYQKIVALIAAVNESTWEHLKLGFWPLLLWSIIEYFVFRKKIRNFFFSKFITLFSFCILVPSVFYIYTFILGDNYLPLDILTFIISVLLGQYFGYKIMTSNKNYNLEKIGVILIVVMVIKFLLFSYFPPKIFLFKDPVSGGYGILNNKNF
jgi:hypothetical protein